MKRAIIQQTARRSLLLGLAVIAVPPGAGFAQEAATPAPPQFTFEPPEGFADLIARQPASLTLYVDGRPLGIVDVDIAPGEVRFADGAALIPRLPPLRTEGEVASALAGALPPNAALSCSPRPIAGCGRVEGDVVAVILSRDAGRIDLFIPQRLRGEARPFLADPPPGPMTLAGGLGINYSLNQRGLDYTVQPRLAVGLGRGHFAFNASFSNRYSSIDQAYYRRDWQGSRLSAGLVHAADYQFVYFDRLVGVQFASSDDLRLESALDADSPLILDVPLDGRVEVLRDGVLLSTQRLAVGRATLDTAGLPGGSYPLTLRITDAAGERTETRLFSRALGLPRYGQTVFFAEAGWNTNFRSSDDGIVPDLLSATARAGITRRIASQWALGLRGEASEARQMLELGIQTVRDGWSANGVLAATVDGEMAASISANGRLAGFNLSLDARHVDGAAGFSTPFDPERGLGRSYSSVSSFVGYSQSRFSLNAGVLWRRDPPGEGSFTFLPNARVTLLQSGGKRLEFDTSGSISRDSWSARAGLRLSFYGGRQSLSLGGGGEARNNNGDTTRRPFGNADWSRSDETGLGPLQLRAGVTQQQGRTSGRAGANLRMAYADVGLDAQIEEQLDNSSLYGRFDTSFGYAGGRMGFGGGGYSGSGLIVEAPDAADDASYSVRANGSGSGRAIRGNAPVFVPMPSYSQGEVGINAGQGTTNFDTRSEHAVFYPGTVRRLVRQSSQVTPVFGILLEEDGTPVAGAIVRTTGGISESGAGGGVQLELGSNGRIEAEREDGSICVAIATGFDARAVFVDLGTLVCRSE